MRWRSDSATRGSRSPTSSTAARRPDKGNIVVRYHGIGSSGRKPLLLLAHLDVVEALKKDWSADLDPFVFTERDGYYYGRGIGRRQGDGVDLRRER